MFFAILIVLFFGFAIVLKIAKGILKLILIVILIAMLAGTFAGKDRIDSTSIAPTTSL